MQEAKVFGCVLFLESQKKLYVSAIDPCTSRPDDKEKRDYLEFLSEQFECCNNDSSWAIPAFLVGKEGRLVLKDLHYVKQVNDGWAILIEIDLDISDTEFPLTNEKIEDIVYNASSVYDFSGNLTTKDSGDPQELYKLIPKK
jgi:hypothetical protein